MSAVPGCQPARISISGYGATVQPVDPLRIESPPVEPVNEENLEAFSLVREMWMEQT
jgi:hypothetical protein